MPTIVPKDNLIDDLQLHKCVAANKIGQVLDMIKSEGSQRMIRTASANNDKIIDLFTQMLATLNMEAGENNVKEIINRMATSENIDKNASINKRNRERKEDIKIASKHVKDSHYQIDLSKDVIKHGDKEVFMVSCYARDAYLGRYLIKRNYFYTMDREKSADKAYDEIITKMSSIKDRYYNDIIKVSGIFTQIKQVLDGVISEIEMKDDKLGTTVER